MIFSTVTELQGLNLPNINSLLDDLFSSNDFDDRMNICDNIIQELESNGYDINSDEIKDLAL